MWTCGEWSEAEEICGELTTKRAIWKSTDEVYIQV